MEQRISTITNLLGETFNDLSLSKASGDVHLGGNVTISGTLTMGGGDIMATDKSLVIGQVRAIPAISIM